MTYLFLFLSALGFLDSMFLTVQHYSRDPLKCPLFGGCEEVTSSIYSEVFGVPVALLGAIYYGTIFLLALFSYLSNHKKYLRLAGFLTPVGLISSGYLVFIMFFVLQAVCFYCMVSAISSTLLFVVFIVNWLSWKKTRNLVKESEKS